ncbi:Prophage PssSM-02, GDSL-like lipase [Pseudomonas syringae pv. pisi]|jgi:hypothetical protein|nr:hypothetical protein [Pseudomonas syringae]RMM28922.1 Prophage PssSM-02, GDSL-like lipase [Pseudomonas syringae pv. pisi]UZS61726.1 hypothetical protein OQB64_21325 [Pseudomonas syringae]
MQTDNSQPAHCRVAACIAVANRKGAGLCEKHYTRQRRHGSTDKAVVTNVVQTNLAAGDVIEMVSAVEIMGSSRGILAWEAELTITKTVGGASSTSYYRSMDKYQEPFTMPASFSGELETQRGTIDLTETVITSRMGLYLAAGVPQDSTVKATQFGIRKV